MAAINYIKLRDEKILEIHIILTTTYNQQYYI